MTDIVDKQTRSRMMAGIRGKDTKPELIIRKELHKLGYRYRLHVKDLPGKPDIVLPKYHAVIFIHGCFWHAHNCHLYRLPKSRIEFWKKKILGNVERDRKNIDQLKHDGWRILIVWECSIKGRTRTGTDIVVHNINNWIKSKNSFTEIRGKEA